MIHRDTFDNEWFGVDSFQRGSGGALKAVVTARYPKTGRLDIYILETDQHRFQVPYKRDIALGHKKGSFGLPAVKTLVSYEPDNGMHDGHPGLGRVTGAIPHTGDEPPSHKTHPSLTSHSFGVQASTKKNAPGALSFYDERSNKTEILPNKHVKQMMGMGAAVNVVQGISATRAEASAKDGSESTDTAVASARSLPTQTTTPDQVQSYQAGMRDVASSSREASNSVAEAAMFQQQTVNGQLNAAEVGQGARQLAEGNPLPDEIT